MRSQDVITERQREMRRADIQEQAQKRDRDHLESQKNQNFTQVYPLGWKRLMELAKGNTAAFDSTHTSLNTLTARVVLYWEIRNSLQANLV